MGRQKSLIHFYAVISGYGKSVKDINEYIPPDIAFAKRDYYTPAVFFYVAGYLDQVPYNGPEPASFDRMFTLWRILAL